MKKLIVVILVSSHFPASSQTARLDSINGCSAIMKSLSKEWKRDSTGNNGYRRENTKFLLECVPDNVDSLLLFELLGKPNRIYRTNHGSSFLYYYYDIMTLPKDFDGPMATAGIQFNYSKKEQYFFSISEFDIDR